MKLRAADYGNSCAGSDATDGSGTRSHQPTGTEGPLSNLLRRDPGGITNGRKGSNLAARFTSREWPESALTRRYPGDRRTRKIAPHPPFAIPPGSAQLDGNPSFGSGSDPRRGGARVRLSSIISSARRSPCGTGGRDEPRAGRATIGGHSGGRCRRLFTTDGRGRRGHARGAACGSP